MANYSLKFNEAAFRKKFAQHIDSDPKIANAVKNLANKIFIRSKDALMREFDEHPITQELKEGPTAANISLTLDGRGNLFSFLGFFDTQSPTEDLELLLRNIKMEKTIRRDNHVYFRVVVPNKTEIEDVTKLNWGTTSWAYAVEDGEFNGDAALSHFVYRSWEAGRSKEGVQIEGEYDEDEEFAPRPYLTEILSNFRDRINGEK